MTTKENKEVVRRMMNIINSGDLSNVGEMLDDSYVYRSSAGEEYRGVDGAKSLVNDYRQAFDNFELSLEELVAEGDKVFMLYRQTGTHTGDLMGLEATNQDMDLLISGLITFKNGKMVEQFDTFDTLELMKQLGVVSEEVRPGGAEWPTGGTQLRPQ